ncbi:MAG TPA: TQO small subunit DoxD [Ktedonobacteraceae bacterium]|nr:TQO small subunit DoxD [Ktedonobacteraceae bacterium]
MKPTSNRPNQTNQPRVANQTNQAQPYVPAAPVARPPQPEPDEPAARRGWKASWLLLPMRLFLGVTFIYAGVQKLANPQYFNPTAVGYIGKQIAGIATGSPLHSFMMAVAVPHAALFGGMVAYGEIAIGLGTLFGFLLRPAAFFGILVNLIFFLTATWRVYPYFYGSDIVFIFCWLTMLISGPTNTGLPSLDEWMMDGLPEPRRQPWAPALAFFLGVSVPPATSATVGQGQRQLAGGKRQAQRYAQAQRAQQQSRRSFIWGAVVGGAGIAAIIWVWNVLNASSATTAGGASTGAPASGTTTASGSSTVIAQISQVPSNSSAQFTVSSSGDPGVLIHLNNGQFVAFDAVCTHAGCPVSYDPSSQLLQCPCHGAAFDPSKGAAVVQGPAPTPLTSVPIKVDNAKGTISQQ